MHWQALLSLLFILIWTFLTLKLLTVSSHMLLSLLVLEFFTMALVFCLITSQCSISTNFELLLVFFTLAVAEASLGLGLLIRVTRKNGSELITLL